MGPFPFPRPGAHRARRLERGSRDRKVRRDDVQGAAQGRARRHHRHAPSTPLQPPPRPSRNPGCSPRQPRRQPRASQAAASGNPGCYPARSRLLPTRLRPLPRASHAATLTLIRCADDLLQQLPRPRCGGAHSLVRRLHRHEPRGRQRAHGGIAHQVPGEIIRK